MPQETGQTVIAGEAIKLAKSLPWQIIQLLAMSIGESDPDDWAASRNRIVQHISHPSYRTLAARFLDNWRAQAGEVSPQAVSLSLLTAANGEKERREDQSLELVWTGPEVGVIPLRRTEQALLQLIGSALQRILIVSYAVYNIPRICEALIEAANRGALITIIIETPDRIEGRNAYNTLKALGSSVADRCNVYLWPLEKRERDANGKPGILHVKCAVADGHWLFLSSANLTEYAFTLNMELGALIVGGVMPEQVENHFYQMIQAGVFAKP
jgi:phosphatidylserine/phosphatidylglycerophosphate/cardiolipin synthase-like enzyme